MNCPISISYTTIRSNKGTWSKSGMKKSMWNTLKMVPFARVGWFKNYEFKSSNLLKIKDSIFASNIKPHCHCKFRELHNRMIQHINRVFSWRKNERRWQKAMSAWMGMGFDKLRKDTTYIKLILVTWCWKFHNFTLPFKCKYTAKCKEINPLITSMMSSGGLIESFVLIYPRPKSPYMNWIWKRELSEIIYV